MNTLKFKKNLSQKKEVLYQKFSTQMVTKFDLWEKLEVDKLLSR